MTLSTFSPAKSLPMQAIMLYMSGSGIQIFSMGIVWMLLTSPFKACFQIIKSEFNLYGSSWTTNHCNLPTDRENSSLRSFVAYRGQLLNRTDKLPPHRLVLHGLYQQKPHRHPLGKARSPPIFLPPCSSTWAVKRSCKPRPHLSLLPVENSFRISTELLADPCPCSHIRPYCRCEHSLIGSDWGFTSVNKWDSSLPERAIGYSSRVGLR